MGLLHRSSRLLCNGLLFLLLGLFETSLMLNVIHPRIPSLKCNGPNILEPSISHKYNGDTVSTMILLTCTLFIPVGQIVFMECFRKCKDYYELIFKSNQTTSWSFKSHSLLTIIRDYVVGFLAVILFVDIAKTTLCAPRPDWLDTCKPYFAKEACINGWVSDYECTNSQLSAWKIMDGKKSFPSGHSAASFYAASFMTVHQSRCVNFRYPGTILILCVHIFWIGFAIFCALSRVADHRHHLLDVGIGGLIGFCGGLFAVQSFSRISCQGLPEETSYQNNENSDSII